MVILVLLAASWTPAAGRGEDVADSKKAAAPSGEQKDPKFYSEDGWLDFSGFLDQAYGFVPIASPITEPAVGYGLAGGLVFVDKTKEHAEPGYRRPNITGVGGLGT